MLPFSRPSSDLLLFYEQSRAKTGQRKFLTMICFLLAAATELDDSEGPQRDFLASSQAALMTALAKAARFGVESGELRADLDGEQFAFELQGILMAYHHARRLLRDPKAEARAKAAFERLLQASRAN
jgi:hypothetical protein